MAKNVLKTAPVRGEFNPDKIIMGKALVSPTLSLKKVNQGDSLYFIYRSEIASREQIESSGVNKGKIKLDPESGEPAVIHTILATNMVSGEAGEVVMPAIVYGASKEEGKLFGRCFRWVKGTETTGKATKWSVTEFFLAED